MHEAGKTFQEPGAARTRVGRNGGSGYPNGMKRWPVLLLSATLAVPSAAAIAAVHEVRIVEVSEGDALVIEDESGSRYPVRLAGIDAPEPGQPFGDAALSRLRDWSLGRAARLEWQKVDRHGRAIGKLWISSPDMPCREEPGCPKNLDLGHALIRAGLAWHFKRYQAEQPEQDRARYAFDEDEARRRKVGLWSDPAAVAPWDWREGKRSP
jgi:endonuclease YncB( thermonuclease family)